LSEPASVLVVEDEYFLQADLEQALTEAGFATEVASSGEQALTLFFAGSRICKALVTDVRLRSALSGWDVARRIRERQPDLPVIYVTGAPADEWASHGVPNSILVSKPFVTAQLIAALSNLLRNGSATTA
jgi:DNA-binding response OmpR family regulator